MFVGVGSKQSRRRNRTRTSDSVDASLTVGNNTPTGNGYLWVGNSTVSSFVNSTFTDAVPLVTTFWAFM